MPKTVMHLMINSVSGEMSGWRRKGSLDPWQLLAILSVGEGVHELRAPGSALRAGRLRSPDGWVTGAAAAPGGGAPQARRPDRGPRCHRKDLNLHLHHAHAPARGLLLDTARRVSPPQDQQQEGGARPRPSGSSGVPSLPRHGRSQAAQNGSCWRTEVRSGLTSASRCHSDAQRHPCMHALVLHQWGADIWAGRRAAAKCASHLLFPIKLRRQDICLGSRLLEPETTNAALCQTFLLLSSILLFCLSPSMHFYCLPLFPSCNNCSFFSIFLSPPFFLVHFFTFTGSSPAFGPSLWFLSASFPLCSPMVL